MDERNSDCCDSRSPVYRIQTAAERELSLGIRSMLSTAGLNRLRATAHLRHDPSFNSSGRLPTETLCSALKVTPSSIALPSSTALPCGAHSECQSRSLDVDVLRRIPGPLGAKGELQPFQREPHKRFVLDQPIHTNAQISTATRSSSVLRSLGLKSVRGVDSALSESVPKGANEHTAPTTPFTSFPEISISNVPIIGARRPLPSSVAAITATGQPSRMVFSHVAKKRKRSNKKGDGTPDKAARMGRRSFNGDNVQSRDVTNISQSGTVETVSQAKNAAQAPAADNEVAVFATLSPLLLLHHQYLREQELLLRRRLSSIGSSDLGMYGNGAWHVPLSIMGGDRPHAMPTHDWPPYPTTSMAGIALPYCAHPKTSSFTFACQPLMRNREKFLDHASLEEQAAWNIRREFLSATAIEQALYSTVRSGSRSKPLYDEIPHEAYSATDPERGLERRDLQDHGRSFPLHINEDKDVISPYQCLLRRQIEVFEASIEEARTSAQGRNRPIIPGQVGIRCRHCGNVEANRRATGAVYFPNRLDGAYQTAQKMAAKHILFHCKSIATETKEELLVLRATTRSSDGGGRRYWSDALLRLGVEETESGGLVLTSSARVPYPTLHNSK